MQKKASFLQAVVAQVDPSVVAVAFAVANKTGKASPPLPERKIPAGHPLFEVGPYPRFFFPRSILVISFSFVDIYEFLTIGRKPCFESTEIATGARQSAFFSCFLLPLGSILVCL
jgi:hypothetical protein